MATDGGSLLDDIYVYDNHLNQVTTLPNLNGGLAFNPVHGLLYTVDASTNELDAWDTDTWSEAFSMNVGEAVGASSPFGDGQMAVSADGSEVFLSTPDGVREFQVAPEPSTLALFAAAAAGLAAYGLRRRPVSRF